MVWEIGLIIGAFVVGVIFGDKIKAWLKSKVDKVVAKFKWTSAI